MKKYLIALPLCAGLIFGSCSSEVVEEPKVDDNPENVNNPEDQKDDLEEYTPYTIIELNEETRGAVELNNSFAFNLLDKVGATEENVVVSPFSVFSVLGMTANGDDGATRDAILNVIGGSSAVSLDAVNAYSKTMLENLPAVDRRSKCEVSNSLWHAPGMTLIPEFSAGITGSYNAQIFDINPSGHEGLEKINSWIESNTGGLIKNFLSKPLEGPVALINTLLFKSGWAMTFDKENNTRSDFTCSDGTVVKTEFMNIELQARHLENSDFEGVELLLGNWNYSVLFIMSKNGNDIPSVDSRQFESMDYHSRMTKIKLSLPMFETSYHGDIRSSLNAMGLTETALNKAVVGESLSVNSILHGVRFGIDEDGVSGAAATLEDWSSAPADDRERKPLILEFNRPFMFVVCEKSTNTILFIGQQSKF